MYKHLRIAVLSLAVASQNLYAGQYQQQCEQSGKKSQQACQGATSTANAGDNAQAGAIGSTVGANASANPGANGMMDQAGAQIGRLSAASNSCQQAKKDCEQKCDQQKQSANGDQKARQQGEPGQVDQSKQSQCSKAMDAQIGPLLMALAAAMAALAMAKNSEEKSDAGTPGSTNPTTTAETPTAATPAAPTDKGGTATFLATPQAKTGIAAIENAGGQVSADGVKMPDGSFQSWSGLAAGGGGSSSGQMGGAGQASLNDASAMATAFPRANVIGAATAEGAGSGSSDASYGATDASDAGGRAPANANYRPASAAGLKVNLDGTPIGAKGDDLFTMIHRAYDRKREANVFMSEAEPPRPPPQQRRLPASAKMPRWYRGPNNP